MSQVAPRQASLPGPSSVNLNRLLSRLEHTLLSPDGDSNLRRSSYERTKVGANIAHARTLLLRLEHDSSTIKTHSLKQSVQSDLQAKRNLIKRLNARLYELEQLDTNQTASSSSGSDTSDNSDDEETHPSYAPAQRGVHGGLDREQDPALQSAAENLSSTLRARRQQPSQPDTGASSALNSSSLSNRETLLSHNRSEQEVLTDSLLSMAQALKNQSLHFGQSLELDREIVDRAGEGLDNSANSMELASKRMGMLRRMTEGRGWWGRMLMYAWIAGLWVVAFAIVFVMPKFRF
ncbi:hypothetical protein M501DRAFT_1005280 [Patellaria atrata CBS 101060]|uniref:t-SNARE coiled-coil homology domain-containing protein n=1 Tax=Patellaria atrata CBS 101060 TaxID=1346257 RepID=A0A9P4S9M2_9PEZI|nr:hypothetical protein M501DRAFT_1005280 [Patellaria atrata CBS 101060]